ncbi:MAG: outer membrane beta-barrel protein [Chitinophagaceae bacterium]
MQENEFEKQVLQKMDEFRLRPSEPVWIQINKELRKKRRRRLLFIPLFATLLIGGYFAWQAIFPETKLTGNTVVVSDSPKTKPTNSTISEKNTSNGSSSLLKDKISSTKNPSADDVKETEHKGSVQGKANNQMNVSVKKLTANKRGSETAGLEKRTDLLTVKKKSKEPDETATLNGDITAKASSKNLQNEKLNYSPTRLAGNTDDFQKIKYQYTVGEAVSLNENHIISRDPVSMSYQSKRQVLMDSLALNNVPALQLPAIKSEQLRNPATLKVGLVLAVGASSRTDKPLQIGSSREKSLPSGFNAAYPSFANGGVLILPPSDVKPGAAFKAGIIAMKSLSRRFDLSTGLIYSYTSDHIQIGKTVYTSVNYNNNYSLDIRAQTSAIGGQTSNYTNKYHFIELPLSAYYNLTGKWKTPLVWNAGVSISRLISTNALLYDEALGGVYYDGNRDFNKTQFNISTGFSFRFAGNGRWQWNIGPEIYVSATKLFDNTYDANKHPLYGGLHIQALMPVKKKRR